MSRVRKFPLVADNETVLQAAKPMQLYENEDLISNIQGPYEDKFFADVTREDKVLMPQASISDSRAAYPENTQEAGKTYAQEAREAAKKDLRKKRHSYVSTSEFAKRQHPFRQAVSSAKSSSGKVPVQTELSRYSERLRQSTYILAELPARYAEPKNKPNKPQKNNYDFLKNSQIYNQKDYQKQKEQQMAQELNLTSFAD